MGSAEFDLGRWVRVRVRLVVGGLLAGAVVGLVATGALALYGDSAAFGTRKAFALGALVLGFGVLGWSGSVIAGRGVENLQRRLETTSGWTEADSRRAMGRIAGFGAGVMLSAGALEALA